MKMYHSDLNFDGISLAGFGFPKPMEWSKNSLRGTGFVTRCVWKVNSFTLHALLVIKSYSLLHLYINNNNVYSIHLLRGRDRLPPHSVKWSKAVLVVNKRHLLFSHASERSGIVNPWIWLANCARSSGPDFPIRTLKCKKWPNKQTIMDSDDDSYHFPKCQTHAYTRFENGCSENSTQKLLTKYSREEIINTLFPGPYWEKLCPRSWVRPSACGLGTVFPNTDTAWKLKYS